MTNPLPRNKDRHGNMELKFHHFKWRGMPVPHQVPNQPAIFIDMLGALAVAHARALHNGEVCRLALRHQPWHAVHQCNKTMIQARNLPARRSVHDIAQRSFRRNNLDGR